ncbi:hypothetical protein JCM3765_001182 [Sporobolomyces pararoseus]
MGEYSNEVLLGAKSLQLSKCSLPILAHAAKVSKLSSQSFPPPPPTSAPRPRRSSQVEVPLLSHRDLDQEEEDLDSDLTTLSPPPEYSSSSSPGQTGATNSLKKKMVNRGLFGLSGRRLHVCLLSFFIVSILLWSQHHSSSSNSARFDLEDQLLDKSDTADMKEGLAEWEAPATTGKPVEKEEELSISLPEDDSKCKSTRPRDKPGHVTAFLIMVHSEATLEGARKLVEQIYDPHDLFLIHADKKMDEGLYVKYKDSLGVCGNVVFVPDDERVNIGWGDITMIDAEIVMLKQALRSTVPWTNMILVDGTSWPILDAARRQEWFDIYEEELSRGGNGQAPAPICKFGEEVIEFQTDCWRTPSRCLNQDCSKMSGTPHEAPIRKGDQWTVLTRKMVKYAIFGEDSTKWYEFFTETAVPDEHFFATIKYAQPGAPTGWLRTPMYVHWGPCRSHPVEKFVGHPCSLGMKDLEHIFGSISMFARKVTLEETELRSEMLRGEPKAIDLPLLS